MKIYLFFHLLTHILLSITIVYVIIPKTIFKNSFILLILGAFCGILPDILEILGIGPISHSILFAPVMILIISFITYFFIKEISFIKIYLSLFFALLLGHIFYDCLEHANKIFYPLSSNDFKLGIITHGDPWIWIPLLIGCIFVLLRNNNSKKYMKIIFLFIVLYLTFKATEKKLIVNNLKLENKLSSSMILTVEPNATYDYPLNPLDWLTFKFSSMNDYFTIRGYRGLFINKADNTWIDFYPDPTEILFLEGQYTRTNVTTSYIVIDYFNIDGTNNLLCKSGNELYIFKEVAQNWVEVIGEDKKKILETYIN